MTSWRKVTAAHFDYFKSAKPVAMPQVDYSVGGRLKRNIDIGHPFNGAHEHCCAVRS